MHVFMTLAVCLLVLFAQSVEAQSAAPAAQAAANGTQTQIESELMRALEARDLPKVRENLIRLKAAGGRAARVVARATAIADILSDEGKEDDALRWFEFAAHEGGAAAQVSLGITYLGAGDRQSDDEAVRWFRLAAQRNDPWALVGLAKLYEGGRAGLPKSAEKADEYYRRAERAGMYGYRRDNESENPKEGEHPGAAAIDTGSVEQTRSSPAGDATGKTPLLAAVESGKLETVRTILSNGADPNGQDADGATPLIAAAELEDVRIAQALLKAGADPNLLDKKGRLPLHAALLHGRDALVTALLNARANVQIKGMAGMSASHMAVLGLYPDAMMPLGALALASLMGGERRPPTGGLTRLAAVLDAGADVNAAADGAITPLFLAVANTGKAQQLQAAEYADLHRAIELLLARGADVNARGTDGSTPLIAAASAGCNTCVKTLLAKGARIDDRDHDGRTALAHAVRARVTVPDDVEVRGGDVEPIAALLKAGADPFIEDNYGLSPLAYALWEVSPDPRRGQEADSALAPFTAFYPRKEELAARIERATKSLNLFRAAATGNLPQAESVLSAGVGADVRSPEGLTPLFFAVAANSRELIRRLSEAGAKPDTASRLGITPLMVAAARCRADIVQELLDRGADPRAIDQYGRTALHRAIPPPQGMWGVRRDDGPLTDRFLQQAVSLNRLPGVAAPQRLSISTEEYERSMTTCDSVAAALASAGADLDAKDGRGKSPLQAACDGKEWKLVHAMLQNEMHPATAACALLARVAIGTKHDVEGALTFAKDHRTLTPSETAAALVLAVERADDAILAALLQAKLKPSGHDAAGVTPLAAAIAAGRHSVARQLLDAGADPNESSAYGNEWSRSEGAPLHIAIARDRLARRSPLSDDVRTNLIQTLVAARADVNAFSPRGKTPLMVAASELDIPVVKLLLDAGADVTSKDSHKSTALGHAAAARAETAEQRAHQLQLLKLLSNEGATVDASTGFGHESPLTVAAGRSDVELVDYLLSAGANVNATSRDGRTPLIAAAEAGNLPLVRKFIGLGADLEAQWAGSGFEVPGTALMRAVAKRHDAVAMELIKAGANVNFRNDAARSPLLIATIEGNAAITAALLDAGADPTGKNEGGDTPLFHAAESGNAEVLQHLIRAGAPIDKRDDEGNTLLFHVVERFNEAAPKSIRLLVNAGVQVNVQNVHGETALHHAAREANEHAVRALLDVGADVRARDAEGRTPLLFAVAESEASVDELAPLARLLIKAGSDIRVPDAQGRTALMIAAAKGDPELVKFVSRLHVDVNAVASAGDTALLAALAEDDADPEERAEVVRTLLRAGANVNTPGNGKNTPLMRATFLGDIALVDLLISARAQIDAQNDDGFTALMFAAAQGNEAMVRRLLKAGANKSLKSVDGDDATSLAHTNKHESVVQILGGS